MSKFENLQEIDLETYDYLYLFKKMIRMLILFPLSRIYV